MLMTLQGDGGEPSSFSAGMNDLDRLLQKLFALCGSPPKKNPLKSDTSDQFNEDDEDISPDLIDNSLDTDTLKMLESFDTR
jgi:hypothetical protein